MSTFLRVVLVGLGLVGALAGALYVASPVAFRELGGRLQQAVSDAVQHRRELSRETSDPNSARGPTPAPIAAPQLPPDAGIAGLPKSYGLFVYHNDTSYDLDDRTQYMSWISRYGASTNLSNVPELILYFPQASFVYRRFRVFRFRWVDSLVTFDKSDFGNSKRIVRAIGQYHAIPCSGESSIEVPMKISPVNGNPDMLRLTPREGSLEPGIYGIYSGAPGCNMSWVPYVSLNQGPKPPGSDKDYERVLAVIGRPDTARDCIYLQFGSGKSGMDGFYSDIFSNEFVSVPCKGQPPSASGPKPDEQPKQGGEPTAPPSQPRPNANQETKRYEATQQTLLLANYPALSQLARESYASNSSKFTGVDVDVNGVKRPIPKLACLATIYAMIERVTGRSNAYVDEFYDVGIGAVDRLSGASVDASRQIDLDRIVVSLRANMPVILHGTGGELKDHFVLVVGAILLSGSATHLIVNDPWPTATQTETGQQRHVDIVRGQLVDSVYEYDTMRLVHTR